MHFKYKRSAIPAIIYLILSFLSLMLVALAPVQASLAGVYLVIVTIPWSFIITEYLDSIRRGTVVPDSVYYSDAMLSIGAMMIGILINAIILLVIFGYFAKSNNKEVHPQNLWVDSRKWGPKRPPS